MNTPENLPFIQWMRQVDFNIEAALGVNSRDLSDMPYREYFDDGLEASEAADEAIMANIEDSGFTLNEFELETEY